MRRGVRVVLLVLPVRFGTLPSPQSDLCRCVGILCNEDEQSARYLGERSGMPTHPLLLGAVVGGWCIVLCMGKWAYAELRRLHLLPKSTSSATVGWVFAPEIFARAVGAAKKPPGCETRIKITYQNYHTVLCHTLW